MTFFWVSDRAPVISRASGNNFFSSLLRAVKSIMLSSAIRDRDLGSFTAVMTSKTASRRYYYLSTNWPQTSARRTHSGFDDHCNKKTKKKEKEKEEEDCNSSRSTMFWQGWLTRYSSRQGNWERTFTITKISSVPLSRVFSLSYKKKMLEVSVVAWFFKNILVKSILTRVLRLIKLIFITCDFYMCYEKDYSNIFFFLVL